MTWEYKTFHNRMHHRGQYSTISKIESWFNKTFNMYACIISYLNPFTPHRLNDLVHDGILRFHYLYFQFNCGFVIRPNHAVLVTKLGSCHSGFAPQHSVDAANWGIYEWNPIMCRVALLIQASFRVQFSLFTKTLLFTNWKCTWLYRLNLRHSLNIHFN